MALLVPELPWLLFSNHVGQCEVIFAFWADACQSWRKGKMPCESGFAKHPGLPKYMAES